MSETRICPDCLLAATRRPELDTKTQIAFRCPSHWHKVVLEDPPQAAPAPPPPPDQPLSAPVVETTVVAADTVAVEDTDPPKKVRAPRKAEG